MEEQTAQITQVSLLVGVTRLTLLHSLVILLSVNQWPLLKAGAACFGKRMQAKGRRHSSSQLIGCSVTTRKRRRGGATKQLMECVTRVCLHTKEVGAGEALRVVLRDQAYFQGVKRGEENLTWESTRYVQEK